MNVCIGVGWKPFISNLYLVTEPNQTFECHLFKCLDLVQLLVAFQLEKFSKQFAK